MKLLKIILSTLALALACSASAAQPDNGGSATTATAQTFPNDDEFEMSLAQNIATPELKGRVIKGVPEHMDNLKRSLRSQGLNATLHRNGEVVMVTIPCHDLFAPNSTDLMPRAEDLLAKLRHVVIHPEDYKVLIAVYADDTGDDEYADALTEDRATAIDEFFFKLAGMQTYVIPYGLGKDDPLVPNDSIENRRKNRRCEIYVVPTLQLAKSV